MGAEGALLVLMVCPLWGPTHLGTALLLTPQLGPGKRDDQPGLAEEMSQGDEEPTEHNWVCFGLTSLSKLSQNFVECKHFHNRVILSLLRSALPRACFHFVACVKNHFSDLSVRLV